jgi:hypothetical protein
MRGQRPGLSACVQLERQPRLHRHPNSRHTRRVKPTRRPIPCPASTCRTLRYLSRETGVIVPGGPAPHDALTFNLDYPTRGLARS